MSVTTHILRLLAEGGCDMDDAIAVAHAMERGDDARRVFELVDTLEARGGAAKPLAQIIVYFAKAIIAEGANKASRRTSANTNTLPSNGPKERWGYEGPITPRLPDKEWWPLRNSVLERDGHVCHYCGDRPERMCADHVVPLSRGGSNDESNLVACCLPCNSSKCDRLLDEWEGRLTA